MIHNKQLNATLFISTFISNQRASQLDRGALATQPRDIVFKYMLASLSVIPFAKSIIYFEVEPDLYQVESELVEYINELFPTAFVQTKRLLRLKDWKAAILYHGLLEENRPIFYLGNDDHIFIDKSLDNICHSLEIFSKLMAIYPHIGFHYSHFIEHLAYWVDLFYDDKVVSAYFEKEGQSAVQIISPYTLKRWFFDQTASLNEDYQIRRSEDIPNTLPIINSLHIRPKSELFRHFDGHSHVGLMELLPPLHVPKNFFTDLKVYCTNHRAGDSNFSTKVNSLKKDEWTVIDPFPLIHSSSHYNGADLDRGLDSMPLFWHRYCRITRTDLSEYHEFDLSAQYRDYLIGKSLNLSNQQQNNVSQAFNAPTSAAQKSIRGANCSRSAQSTGKRTLFVHKIPLVREHFLSVLIVHRAPSVTYLGRIIEELRLFKSVQAEAKLGLYTLCHGIDGDYPGQLHTHGPTTFLSSYGNSSSIDGIFSFRSTRFPSDYTDLFILECLSQAINSQFVLMIEQSFATAIWSIVPLLSSLVGDLNVLAEGYSSVIYPSELRLGNQTLTCKSTAILTDPRFLRMAIRSLAFDRDSLHRPSLVERISNDIGIGNIGLRARFKNYGQVYSGPLYSTHGYYVLGPHQL